MASNLIITPRLTSSEFGGSSAFVSLQIGGGWNGFSILTRVPLSPYLPSYCKKKFTFFYWVRGFFSGFFFFSLSKKYSSHFFVWVCVWGWKVTQLDNHHLSAGMKTKDQNTKKRKHRTKSQIPIQRRHLITKNKKMYQKKQNRQTKSNTLKDSRN